MSRLQIGLALGMLAYAALLTATMNSFRLPADRGIRTATSQGQLSVNWVMPASTAWDAGIRPGDRLPAGLPPSRQVVEVQTARGSVLLLAPGHWRLHGLAAAAMVAAGGLILCIAVSAVVRTRRVQEACVLVGPFFPVGIALSIAPATSASHGWALALTFACVLVLGPAFLSASRSIAKPTGRLGQRWRFYQVGLLALGAGALLAYLAALATGGRTYALARGLEDACLAAGVGGGTLLAFRRLPLLRSASVSTGAIVLLVGTAVGLLLVTVCHFTPHNGSDAGSGEAGRAHEGAA